MRWKKLNIFYILALFPHHNSVYTGVNIFLTIIITDLSLSGNLYSRLKNGQVSKRNNLYRMWNSDKFQGEKIKQEKSWRGAYVWKCICDRIKDV